MNFAENACNGLSGGVLISANRPFVVLNIGMMLPLIMSTKCGIQPHSSITTLDAGLPRTELPLLTFTPLMSKMLPFGKMYDRPFLTGIIFGGKKESACTTDCLVM